MSARPPIDLYRKLRDINTITIGAGDYVVTQLDFEIRANVSSGDATVYLPPALGSKQHVRVKKVVASDNIVNIIADGSDLIDDSGSVTLVDEFSDVWLIDAEPGVWDHTGPTIPNTGVPEGGTAGQILAKISSDDADTEWVDPPTGTILPAVARPATLNEVITAGVSIGLWPCVAFFLLIASVYGADFGDIPANLTMSAGKAVRRNAGNTLFEAYTPSSFSGLFTALDFTGSNLTSITTRSYNDLQNLPTLFTQADADLLYSDIAHTHTFASLTSTPTTLSGYGITDGVPNTRTVNGQALSSNVTLTTASISDSTDKRYVTDADLVVLGNTSGTNTGDQDLSGYVPTTRTVNGHALSSNVTVTPTDLSLVIGTDVQAHDTDLDTWATKTPYAGSLTITTGKTFNVTNTLTLSGTDSSTLNIGAGGTLGSNAFTSTAYVPTSRTINGYPLTSNISLSAPDFNLVIGTDVEAWSDLLDSIALLDYTGNAGKAIVVNGTEDGFELATITGGGGVAWGDITGTLSDQTDLQAELDAKQPLDSDLTSWAGVTRASGFDTFTATPSSANLRGLLTDESGTGAFLTTNGSAASLTSFPTFNQDTTGSAASLSISGQSGLLTVTGLASTNRIKTVRDAADTILELGGSYTPSGTWTSLTMVTPVLGTPASGNLANCTFPTLNQNTTGSAATLTTARNLWGQSFNGSADVGGAIELGTTGSTDKTLDINGGTGRLQIEGVNLVIPADNLGVFAASTSAAIGVGSIELGHASDTTIARSGAGAITVEGTAVLLSGGALGTPSSGTLTNATGLPISGLAASTSTALGVGSIELGHASDTTISRVSAGVIAVEGINLLLTGGALGTPSSGTLTNCTFPTLNQDTTGSAVYWKTSGTGKGSITGPTTGTVRSYTFPDADSTMLYSGGALGTPSSGTLTNCTFPTLNQDTTGSAVYWKTSGTGKGAITGPATGTTRTYTFPDADATVLYSGGALGTPASGTLTNATGLPIAGLTASTSTALGVGSIELGAASDTTIARSGAGAITVEGTAVLLSGGALGTPSSGTLTNATGLPVAGITASTSTALGVGSIELGAASDTTLSRSGAGVLQVEGVVIPSISSTNTLTNKRVVPRTHTTTSTTSFTPDFDTYDEETQTALAGAITIAAPTYASTNEGETRIIRLKDNGTARGITWTTGSSGAFRASSDLALPTTTTLSKTLYMLFIYNATDSRWDLLAKLDNF